MGSQNNDPFYIDEKGHVMTKTNNHGGILGGISSGMPITLNVAIKPTASIAKPQETVDFRAKTNEMLQIQGRHDPCIVAPCSALCGSGGEHRSAFPYDGLSAFLRKHCRLHL